MRLAALCALAVLAGCTNFKDAIQDETQLEGPAKGDLGRELLVHVNGADPELAGQIIDAVAADLEHGDLFDEVQADPDAAPIASSARLTVFVRRVDTDTVHDFWRQRDGYVARYEVDCVLTDRAGHDVLWGSVSGIGYDDVTDPDKLYEAKRQEIREAARRDAAQKVGSMLRRAAEAKADAALRAIEKIHLPPGVGPVRIAALGFDDDPAARRRRGPQLTRAVAGALQRLGPDLDIVPPMEVEQELGASPESRPKSFEKIGASELDRMIPRLGMRFIVVGKVNADGNRVEATAWLRPTKENAPAIATATSAGEGPGALSLVAVELAKQLGAQVEKNPPAVLPKRDEND